MTKLSKGQKITIGIISALIVAGLAGGGIYFITHQGNDQPTTIVSNDQATGTGPIALKDGENKINAGGTYTFTGSAANGKIEVDTTEPVKIILNNVSITNPSGAAIKCKEGTNVTIELVGTNTLISTDKGTAEDDPANVISSDGDLTFVGDGSVSVSGNDKGIHADGKIVIDGGTFKIAGTEGIEATNIVINGGDINIEATDDGINASQKSNNYSIAFEMNGGNVTITMGPGDTDAIDSNGDIYINGGTLTITGQSPFDYDGTAKYSGGTMVINGQTTTTITNQFNGQAGGAMPGGQAAQGQAQTPPQKRM